MSITWLGHRSISHMVLIGISRTNLYDKNYFKKHIKSFKNLDIKRSPNNYQLCKIVRLVGFYGKVCKPSNARVLQFNPSSMWLHTYITIVQSDLTLILYVIFTLQHTMKNLKKIFQIFVLSWLIYYTDETGTHMMWLAKWSSYGQILAKLTKNVTQSSNYCNNMLPKQQKQMLHIFLLEAKLFFKQISLHLQWSHPIQTLFSTPILLAIYPMLKYQCHHRLPLAQQMPQWQMDASHLEGVISQEVTWLVHLDLGYLLLVQWHC